MLSGSRLCAALRYLQMPRQISKPDKTSLVIDRKKVAEAKKILGTSTLAETVDAALDEVVRLAARRRLMERIRRDGGIGPAPEELRRLRAPRRAPLPR
jgi:Arc/MetJ family transcription regulator